MTAKIGRIIHVGNSGIEGEGAIVGVDEGIGVCAGEGEGEGEGEKKGKRGLYVPSDPPTVPETSANPQIIVCNCYLEHYNNELLGLRCVYNQSYSDCTSQRNVNLVTEQACFSALIGSGFRGKCFTKLVLVCLILLLERVVCWFGVNWHSCAILRNCFYPSPDTRSYEINCVGDMMHSLKIVVAAIFALTILFWVGTSFALTYGPNNGYAQYKVTASGTANSFQSVSGIVNESAQPTGQTGIVNIILGISSTMANITYSKDVNTTSLPEIFPYLPAIVNQSLSYQTQGISISASLINAGQTSITFNDTTYQATKFLISFSAVNSSNTLSFSGNGTIISLPSGLIDTVQLSLNQTASINATLLSTNLSLNAPSGNINTIGASALGVALVAAVAIAAPTIYTREKKKKHEEQSTEDENKTSQENDSKQENENEKKPSYWVD